MKVYPKPIDESFEKKQANRYKYSIEDARDTLDRIIGFVSNCDTKASVVLGVLGVMLTIIATDSAISKLLLLIKTAASSGTALSVILLFLLVVAFTAFAFGMLILVSVLVAKTGTSKNDSKIYFTDIASNKNKTTYKEKVLKQLECDAIDDLISQIYINAVICDKKFKKYKLGLKFTLIGGAMFIILIGVLVYTTGGGING